MFSDQDLIFYVHKKFLWIAFYVLLVFSYDWTLESHASNMAPVIAIWFVPNNAAYAGQTRKSGIKVDKESKSTYFNNRFFPTTDYVSS